jgi:hypothetical protein
MLASPRDVIGLAIDPTSWKRPAVPRVAAACDPPCEQSHRFNGKKTIESRKPRFDRPTLHAGQDIGIQTLL